MKKLLGFLLPTITALMIVILVVFVYYPWVGEVFASRVKITEKKDNLTILQAKAQVLQDLDEKQVENYLLELELLVPSQPLPGYLLSTLEDDANLSGIIIKDLQYASTAVQKEKVVLGFLIEGDIEQQKYFLELLKKDAPLMEVSKVDLLKDQAEGALFTNSVLLSSPIQSIPESLSAIETPIEGLSTKDQDLLKKIRDFELLELGGEETKVQTEKPQGKADLFTL